MIGQLKHRAKIEKMHKTDNGRGGWTETPQDLGEVWVAHYRITQRLLTEFRQRGLEAEEKFMARYNEDIDDTTRMTVNGRKYRVESVELPTDPTDYMSIYALEER